jgi:hypothetical protein
MKKIECDFTLEGWFVETPLPKKRKNFKYHHIVITSDGVFQNGSLIAKGKLKLINK